MYPVPDAIFVLVSALDPSEQTFSVFPNIRDARFLQPLKANFPILVATGKSTLVRFAQLLKAESPTLVATGKPMLVSFVQLKKAAYPILVATGKSTLVRFVQLLKAYDPTLATRSFTYSPLNVLSTSAI